MSKVFNMVCGGSSEVKIYTGTVTVQKEQNNISDLVIDTGVPLKDGDIISILLQSNSPGLEYTMKWGSSYGCVYPSIQAVLGVSADIQKLNAAAGNNDGFVKSISTSLNSDGLAFVSYEGTSVTIKSIIPKIGDYGNQTSFTYFWKLISNN